MPSAMEAPSTRLHVDELILDYLLWFCTSSLLAEHRVRDQMQEGKRDGDGKGDDDMGRGESASASARQQQAREAVRNGDMGIRLVNNFYQTFQRLHPHSPLPAPLSLRLRVCRFAGMLLRRLDVTAAGFAPPADASRARAQRWLLRRGQASVLAVGEGDGNGRGQGQGQEDQGCDQSEGPGEGAFAQPATPFSRVETLPPSAPTPTPASDDEALYGQATLRDAQWEFLQLTAHLCARRGEVADAWIEAAVEFMIQAALEAYRCHGCAGVAALNECFAVGPTPLGATGLAGLTDDELVVNELFGGDDGRVAAEFERSRAEALSEMNPPPGTSLEDYFDQLAQRRYMWTEFAAIMVNYLSAAAKGQPRPVLVQLEQGRLDGFDPQDVAAVLRGAGVAEDVWRR